MSDLQPSFQGALWFKRWSDSSTQGVQVTFALSDAEELEPLKAKIGKRFACVLVEIGDDEKPVPSMFSDRRGPYCREACDLCRNLFFTSWVAEVAGLPAGSVSERDAREWILATCGVTSRKDLDSNPEAAELFISQVRVPFMKWQRSNARAQDRATT
jgi:hypothetical protein